MSRIIIKNLPLYLTEDKLKKHFSAKGNVTDVKLMKTRDGRSRRFGFIGYKTDSEAVEAVRFFNDSFIDTAKLAVEIAKTTNDDSLVSSEQRHLKNKEKRRRQEQQLEEALSRKKQKHTVAKETKADDNEDPQLAEYLGAMNAKKGVKSWANDDILPVNSDAPVASTTTVIPDDPEDDEYIQMPEQKSSENVENVEEEEEKFVSLSDFAKDEDQPETKEVTEEGEDSELAKDENVSDLDWLRMRRQRMVENSKPKDAADVAGVEQTNENITIVSPATVADIVVEQEDEEPSEQDKFREKISKTGRLFLRNLLYSATEEEFRGLFGRFGELEEVHIPVDPKSGKAKGFAYVLYKNSEDAVAAYENLDRTIFQGRLLHILPADAKKEHKLDEFDLKNLPLKKQNELRRKAAAAKQQFSWNSLYLNSDAIMETAAKKLGITKSELINPESSDSAVQQALAESSAINTVKEYFESKGVDLLSFNRKEKSDNVILVKNLPFDTSLEEITDMFSTYGELRKVLMPPDGGIAMVVFKNAPQARAAFTKLAYRRVKSSILYLEKGPKGIFEGDQDAPDRNEVSAPVSSAKEAKVSASDILGTAPGVGEAGLVERTSLFVKNLNFKTTSADLHNAFKALEGYLVAQVKQKPDAKNPGKTLSMGFGFVEFSSRETANVALNAMDGFVLDGHKLQLKISNRGQDKTDDSTLVSGQKAKSKILIKNIPFEATKKDIQKLFGTFGQLRTVRLPKKFNKSARGFAFAEFVTAKEAENAMKALQGTHLLGRRLVMEYAEADAENGEEQISRMEEKMRKQVTNETLAGMRLSGKQKNIDLEDEENGLDGF
ncbi:Mrd1p [Sugiyamaella lignohabitans]|uniref:Multiple RNA-binding domain-containing protein 1 n=1 Tax=Sugiyamaella lignohabitans TaxID=796027 RepID=A0A167DUZ1_9ASCO|nr:Mrd1p [Sugiyamaella lignohabitans]ANB13322.1 Mrd1p [Sugiyamaella lignohabitans]